MRLTRNQIHFLGYKITDQLHVKGLIEPEDPDALVESVVELITENLRQEDELNEEVRKLLDKYGEQIRTGGAEYREMFKLVKKRMAREQGIIL